MNFYLTLRREDLWYMSESWGELSALLTTRASAKKVPLIGEFELTSRCNLSCQMCYICKSAGDIEAKKRELSAKEWIALGQEAVKAGTLFISLTGGEIFLREDFKEIYEAYTKMGFNITLNTNGTLITPKIASWLGNIAPSQIDITLYGASRETYQKVCGNPDAFNATLEGIALLQDQGINVRIRSTIIKSNIADYPKLVEIAKGLHMELGIVNYISPRRDDMIKDPQEVRLSPKELANFEMDIINNWEGSKEEPDTLELEAQILRDLDPALKEILTAHSVFPCNAGKISYWITWDGRMIPCPNMNQPNANPFKEGLVNAWERLKKQCNTIPESPKCTGCVYIDQCCSCPANLYGETGHFNKPADYLCELAIERSRLRGLQVI